MSETIIRQMVQSLDQMLQPLAPPGVTGMQFVGVFLLVYSIIFVFLEGVKFPNNDRKSVRAVMALVAAYFTASSTFSTVLISNLFPQLGIIVVGIMAFLLLLAMLAPDSFSKWPLKGVSIVILMGLIIWGAWEATASELSLARLEIPQLSPEAWTAIIGGIIILVLIMAITGFPKMGGGGKAKEAVKKVFMFPED